MKLLNKEEKARARKAARETKMSAAKTRHLKGVVGYALSEAEACEDGICPEQRDAFLAIAGTAARELIRRGKL